MAVANDRKIRIVAKDVTRPPRSTLSIRALDPPVSSDSLPDLASLWTGALVSELTRLGLDPRRVVPPQDPLSRLQQWPHVEVDIPSIGAPTLSQIRRATFDATAAAQRAARDFAGANTPAPAGATSPTPAGQTGVGTEGTDTAKEEAARKARSSEIGDIAIEDSVKAITMIVTAGKMLGHGMGLSRGLQSGRS